MNILNNIANKVESYKALTGSNPVSVAISESAFQGVKDDLLKQNMSSLVGVSIGQSAQVAGNDVVITGEKKSRWLL